MMDVILIALCLVSLGTLLYEIIQSNKSLKRMKVQNEELNSLFDRHDKLVDKLINQLRDDIKNPDSGPQVYRHASRQKPVIMSDSDIFTREQEQKDGHKGHD